MNRMVPPGAPSALRPDLAAIAEMIPVGARVLDIGCGDGSLLEYLVRAKNVDGRGLELIQQNVNQCVARGLSVVQGDADTDLSEYPSGVFDIVILNFPYLYESVAPRPEGQRLSRPPVSGPAFPG